MADAPDKKEIQIRTDPKLLETFENIKKSIAEIDDIRELHALRNTAKGYEEAWRAQYDSSGFGRDHMFLGWETKVRSERRMGELLPDLIEHGGDRKTKSSLHRERLKNLGITDIQSHRFQKLYKKFNDRKFNKRIENLRGSFIEPATRWLLSATDITRINAISTNIWNTPSKYIESAREVMGHFDVDPASNKEANKTIKATRIYTERDSGLEYDWPGKVWLNPPYGGIAEDFTEKLIQQYTNGITTEAILLVNANSTDTKWFAPLWDYVLCFTNHRINFVSPESEEGGSTHGSVFIYLGNRVAKFVKNFKQFGPVVMRVDNDDKK